MASHERPEEIIIIGAGIAGLSAAEHLHKKGFTNVTILEAKDRFGGRIWSEHFGKKPEDFVELGAQYVGGLTQMCSIYTLGNQIGMKYNKTATDELARTTEKGHVYSSGGWLIEPYIIEKVNELMEDWWDETEEVSKSTSLEKSLTDYMNRSVLSEFDDEEEDEEVRSYFNYMRNWMRLMEGTAPSEYELYIKDWDNAPQDLPGHSCEARGRLDQLTDAVAKRFPAEWIKLSTPVTNVKWGAEKTQVTCTESGDTKVYTADHVIVTCPLGFLKKHHEDLFDPALPKHKIDAIKKIPFGNIGKIFMEFDIPFWEPEKSEMTVAWTDEEFSEDVGANWMRRISHFEMAQNSNNVLIAWITCEGADMIEKLSDEEVSEGVMELLRKMIRNPSLPDPVRILKSAWRIDPWTLGVYSSKGHSSHKHREALAAPLVVKGVPRVLFAGEATDKSFPGYMHGARDTGLRTAVTLAKIKSKTKRNSTNL